MKKNALFVLTIITATTAIAAPLSPQEALTRAANETRHKIVSNSFNPVPALVITSESSSPAAYVFNDSKSNGFLILSADDVAYPVLGYSKAGKFDPDNIPPQMQWWLSEYARMIDWASDKAGTPANAPVFDSSWQKVDPLCSTKWDQSAPYNDECPIDVRTGKRCVTGCVATSMAQALKYFNYPASGEGTVSYYPGNVGKTLSLNFSEVVFDWDNMLDVYSRGGYNSTQSTAVATLMKACGYSVEMNYGSDASGASGKAISTSLKKYFKYDSNCRTENRMMYSMSDWTSKVYNNIANIGPVIINGSDPGDAGHSFIVDGYDGNGYFHLNWGWGGISDGYFALDALNPDSMGIGGYGSGFNYNQNGIFGIQPPTGGPVEQEIPNLVQSGNLRATINGSTVYFTTADYSFYGSEGWMNYTDELVTGYFGVRFESVSETESVDYIDAQFGSTKTITVYPNGICSSGKKINAVLPTLPVGKYKATLMFKPENYNWQEILVPWGYNNYVYLENTGESWEVSYPDWNYFLIESASIDSELYNGFNVLVKAKFANHSDLQLTQGVTPCLMSGDQFKFLGPNLLVTLEPNETVEKEMILMFEQFGSFTSPAELTLRFINRENNVSYGDFGTYTMSTGPKTTMLTLNNLSIEGSSVATIDYAGAPRNVYIVSNPNQFTVDFSYKVRIGYFDKIIQLALYEIDPEKFNILLPVEGLSPVFSDIPFLNADEVSENHVNVSFSGADPDRLYAIRAEYGGAGNWKNLGSPIYWTCNTSGVNDVISDSVENVTFFNLQGQRIDNPVKGQILILREGEKTRKVIY